MFTNLIQTNLTTTVLGKNIEHYTWTESTNDNAWELIEEGAVEGTVVITDKQTAGKGRAGRDWVTTPGKSLTASLILNPSVKSGCTIHVPLAHTRPPF